MNYYLQLSCFYVSITSVDTFCCNQVVTCDADSYNYCTACKRNHRKRWNKLQKHIFEYSVAGISLIRFGVERFPCTFTYSGNVFGELHSPRVYKLVGIVCHFVDRQADFGPRATNNVMSLPTGITRELRLHLRRRRHYHRVSRNRYSCSAAWDLRPFMRRADKYLAGWR